MLESFLLAMLLIEGSSLPRTVAVSVGDGAQHTRLRRLEILCRTSKVVQSFRTTHRILPSVWKGAVQGDTALLRLQNIMYLRKIDVVACCQKRNVAAVLSCLEDIRWRRVDSLCAGDYQLPFRIESSVFMTDRIQECCHKIGVARYNCFHGQLSYKQGASHFLLDETDPVNDVFDYYNHSLLDTKAETVRSSRPQRRRDIFQTDNSQSQSLLSRSYRRKKQQWREIKSEIVTASPPSTLMKSLTAATESSVQESRLAYTTEHTVSHSAENSFNKKSSSQYIGRPEPTQQGSTITVSWDLASTTLKPTPEKTRLKGAHVTMRQKLKHPSVKYVPKVSHKTARFKPKQRNPAVFARLMKSRQSDVKPSSSVSSRQLDARQHSLSKSDLDSRSSFKGRKSSRGLQTRVSKQNRNKRKKKADKTVLTEHGRRPLISNKASLIWSNNKRRSKQHKKGIRKKTKPKPRRKFKCLRCKFSRSSSNVHKRTRARVISPCNRKSSGGVSRQRYCLYSVIHVVIPRPDTPTKQPATSENIFQLLRKKFPHDTWHSIQS